MIFWQIGRKTGPDISPWLVIYSVVMDLLIINCGSSSLSYKVYRAESNAELTVIAAGKAHHVGVRSQEAPYLTHQIGDQSLRQAVDLPNHITAAEHILETLRLYKVPIDAVGHRFVQGGTSFTETTRITVENLERLKACSPLAPIHNPSSFSVLQLCGERLGNPPQFASFDTAFHARIPEAVQRYAIPCAISDDLVLRKFGAHGLSYQYVTAQTAKYMGIPKETLRLVACHLGTGGSSAAAIAAGYSLDTSMGYTPLAGLIMGTRSGDIDPSVVLTLIMRDGYTPEQVHRLLNKESGLLGISGFSSDLFEVVARAESGDRYARLAVDMYVHRLKFFISGYIGILGECHTLAFTDDIGQRCWQVRLAACAGLERLGVKLDPDANRAADGRTLQEVSTPGSAIRVLVVPTDEEYVIAEEGYRLFQ